jgi:glutamine synthetase
MGFAESAAVDIVGLVQTTSVVDDALVVEEAWVEVAKTARNVTIVVDIDSASADKEDVVVEEVVVDEESILAAETVEESDDYYKSVVMVEEEFL